MGVGLYLVLEQSLMFMGRCDYCLIALETGNICPTCSETVKLKEPPTSETERLLAGSLAIAELAALRKKIEKFQIWLEGRKDIGISYRLAKQHLEMLLEDL